MQGAGEGVGADVHAQKGWRSCLAPYSFGADAKDTSASFTLGPRRALR